MGEFAEVIQKWKNEVEDEAIKLIERGMPPWQATEKAVQIVSYRRRRERADKSRS
uniref:Uncharacterized protein n=1 Tax=viral metagenome TaxID=1070528 RepID=A0A6M3LLN5_9ZZZZ